MKKVLSIIVLILCSLASVFGIILLTELIFKLIPLLYNSSRALFWVILIAGGSFGLGLMWFLICFASTFTITLSQKLSLSKKGTRYTVMGILIIAYYVLNNVFALIINDYPVITIVYLILITIYIVAFGVMLIVQGRETAQEEYIEPINTATDNTPAANENTVSTSVTNDAILPKEIPVDSLKALKELHDSDVISTEEYEMKKRQLLDI